MLHEYHFLLNQKLYNELLKLSKCLNKNISETIVFAFKNLNPLVEKKQLTLEEQGSKYKILAGLDEKRCHVHCYLPEHFYRKLKQIHNDLDVYSIAQILRKILEVFLKGCSKYGKYVFVKRLNNITINWENIKSKYQAEKRVFIRQMSYKFNNFPNYLIGYGKDSRPYYIQFI
jgi:hypothetical protein